MSFITNRFLAKAFQHPVRKWLYGFAAGYGFTMAANIGTAVTDDQNAPISWYTDDRSDFMTIAGMKSLYYGLMWPVIPVAVLLRPRSFFVLGGACKVTKYDGYFDIRYGKQPETIAININR